MWKRKTWSRKPSRSFGARRGSTHAVTRTRKWEVGQLFIDTEQTLSGGSAVENLQFFNLASIPVSLGNAASGSEARIGNTLAQMNRALEIGGVVYDWGFQWMSDVNVGSVTFERGEAEAFGFHALVTDRIVNDSGNNTPPSVASWAPWTPSFPMSILGASTPPEASDTANAPTRIHFQKSFWSSGTGRRLTNPEESTLYVPDDQSLNQKFGTVNRRLRLRLNDEQGLFATFGLRSGAGNSITQTYKFWLHGKLYYRFRQ